MSDEFGGWDARILERLLATTREGFWFIDNETNTIDVNPAMCAILDRPREAILGRSIFEFVDAANKAVFEREIAARRAGALGHYEVSLLRSDGTSIPCINNATPVLDDDGNKIASIGLWTDVSELKATEHSLQEAKARAESASRAKSEFLSSMSHELRTPLHAILGFAQLLESDADFPLGSTQRDQITRILRSGDHLLDLINKVLDLEQIEQGDLPLDIAPVSPRAAVDHALDVARAMARSRAIQVRDDTAGAPLPNLRADETRLRQVLLNLVSNAVKYNKPGGDVVFSHAREADGGSRFTVADTGPGIADAARGRIFQPFDRLGMEASAIEGAGIGLSLTKQLVELMGGRIDFESTPGQGTRFHVTLPAAETIAAEAEAPPTVIPTAPTGPRLVLYVEDNPDLLELMGRIAERAAGVELISAHTAELGLVLARERRPDLILLDINLPGINGIEARTALRKAPETAQIPVIAVTGNAMAHNRRQYDAAGFDGVLAKPFKISEVRELFADPRAFLSVGG